MLIWSMKAGALENISTGTLPRMRGTRLPATTVGATVVRKWIVTWKTHISLCLDSLSTNLTTIGWNSFSSTKECAFGTIRNTPL